MRAGGGNGAIRWRHAAAALAIAALAGAWLWASGRPPICDCGYVALWHGALDAGNSQHLADWYTPSHILHGILFYAVAWLIARPGRVGGRWLVAAVAIEAAWEAIENSPAVIDRYRTATIALGYSGDSVVNSLADIGWMAAGFLLARRLPVTVTILLALALELAALAAIRDNLTLNVLMLLHPVEAIRAWQSGA
ncbi:MAG: DUF2585 family protein [Sphingomonas fennica]